MVLDNKIYWIWLAELMGQGSKLAAKLINLCGDAQAVYETPVEELCKRDVFSSEERHALKKVLSARDTWPAERIYQNCRRMHIQMATPASPEFPGSLRSLVDMPLVLYYYGQLPDCGERLLVSVVGTRKMTPYGRKIAYSLGYGLGLGGAIVTSGMALGTDSMALVGALDSGADVIAVLGSGVDVIYPREHEALYQRIMEHGAVISEYPPGSSPAGHHFPVRNRIISGLSQGTVVVEGNATSGALITARHAVAQGRTLFAVPGKVGETSSEGPLRLLREGAVPVSEAADVLVEFAFLFPHTVNLNFLGSRLRHFDFESESRKAMDQSRIGVRKDGGAAPAVPASECRSRPSAAQKMAEKIDGREAAEKPENRRDIPKKTQAKKISTEKPVKNGAMSEEKLNFTTGFALNMLDQTDWKVYNIMQLNVPTVPDSIVQDDLPISDIMSALSTLELAGLVESSAGGYYIRVGENVPVTMDDDLPEQEHE